MLISRCYRGKMPLEVIFMPISSENTRTLITISKELKAKLEQQAKKEKRSFNNLIVSILEEYTENKELFT